MTTKTKHSNDCSRVFKNYDKDCARCQELKAGAKPRDGWQKEYYQKKKEEEEARYSRVNRDGYCQHGVTNLNPGGYCNSCGAGRDFS